MKIGDYVEITEKWQSFKPGDILKVVLVDPVSRYRPVGVLDSNDVILWPPCHQFKISDKLNESIVDGK